MCSRDTRRFPAERLNGPDLRKPFAAEHNHAHEREHDAESRFHDLSGDVLADPRPDGAADQHARDRPGNDVPDRRGSERVDSRAGDRGDGEHEHARRDRHSGWESTPNDQLRRRDLRESGADQAGDEPTGGRGDRRWQRPIAVTWCPICASAVVYVQPVDDRVLTSVPRGNSSTTRSLCTREMASEWKQLLRGSAMNADGFVKVIIDLDREMLGCHIIGLDAADLIQEVVVAMKAGTGTVQDICESVYIHPALSEVVQRAFAGQLSRGGDSRHSHS